MLCPTCLIEIRQIEYSLDVLRQPTDSMELFAFISCAMRSPADIDPLVVRFNSLSGKYIVVCDGPAYEQEGILLEAARKLGLSNLPCRVIDYTHPTAGGAVPSPTPAPIMAQHALLASWPGASALDHHHFNALFHDLLHAIARMAGGVRRRKKAVLRVTDDEDWQQEACLALWRELRDRDRLRLDVASSVRRFVFRLLGKQAARATFLARRTDQLLHDPTKSSGSVLYELIAAEKEQQFDKKVECLQELLDLVDRVLSETVFRLPVRKATAIRAWLNGAGYRAAGVTVNMTLSQVRQVVVRLKKGKLGPLLSRARRNLEALYRVCPAAAAQIRLGQLARLLADPVEP